MPLHNLSCSHFPSRVALALEHTADVEAEVRHVARAADLDRDGAAGAALLPEDRIDRLQQERLHADRHLRDFRVEQELAPEVERLGLERVRPRQLDFRAGHGEGDVRQHEPAIRERETSLEVRDDALLLRLRRLPASTLAQLFDLSLHVVVGESRSENREPSIQPQALGDVVLAGRQHEFRREREPADHWRCRRPDRHRHDVFDARLVHRDIECDRAAVLSLRRVEHGARRVQGGAQEPAVNHFQPRVAVGAVDECLIFHVERERMTADLDREVGRVGLAVGLELAQIPFKFPGKENTSSPFSS